MRLQLNCRAIALTSDNAVLPALLVGLVNGILVPVVGNLRLRCLKMKMKKERKKNRHRGLLHDNISDVGSMCSDSRYNEGYMLSSFYRGSIYTWKSTTAMSIIKNTNRN